MKSSGSAWPLGRERLPTRISSRSQPPRGPGMYWKLYASPGEARCGASLLSPEYFLRSQTDDKILGESLGIALDRLI